MHFIEKELVSLQLGDEPPRSRRGAWVASVLLVFIVATSTIFWWGPAIPTATEVDPTTPRIERAEEAPSGSPLLTASGYVVARRKAVVSAKIQGRLAELNVEEGSQVHQGQVIARLESQDDHDAQVWRAETAVQQAETQIAARRAAIRRAEADLAR